MFILPQTQFPDLLSVPLCIFKDWSDLGRQPGLYMTVVRWRLCWEILVSRSVFGPQSTWSLEFVHDFGSMPALTCFQVVTIFPLQLSFWPLSITSATYSDQMSSFLSDWTAQFRSNDLWSQPSSQSSLSAHSSLGANTWRHRKTYDTQPVLRSLRSLSWSPAIGRKGQRDAFAVKPFSSWKYPNILRISLHRREKHSHSN